MSTTTTNNQQPAAELATQPATVGTFTASRKALAAALARLTTTTARRSGKAVLQAVRVSVNGSVDLFATDCDRWHTETVATDDKAGELETLVNAAEFRQAVNACHDETVRVDLAANGISVIGQHSRRTVPAAAAVDEQPEPYHFEPAAGYMRTVAGRWFGSAATLAELIRSTEFAADNESSRFALSALLVELQAGTVAGSFCNLVGTDGRRLAQAATDEPEPKPAELVTALWKRDHATKAGKALTDKAARFALLQIVNETPKPKAEAVNVPAVIGKAPKRKPKAEAEPEPVPFVQLFVFNANRDILAAFTFRTVEGRFPKWRDVIPYHYGGTPAVYSVDSTELATLAGSAVAAGNEYNRGVDWTFNADGDHWLTASIPNFAAEALATAEADCANAEALKQWKAAELVNMETPAAVEAWQAAKPQPIEPKTVAPLFVSSIQLNNHETATASICLDGRFVHEFAAAFGKPSVPVDITFKDSESPALLSSYRFQRVKPNRSGVSVRYVVMPLSRDRK